MLRLNLKTPPSTCYQESSLMSIARGLILQECFYSLRHTSRDSLQDQPPPPLFFFFCTWKHSRMLIRGTIAYLNQCFPPCGPPAPAGGAGGRSRGQQHELSLSKRSVAPARERHNPLHVLPAARKPTPPPPPQKNPPKPHSKSWNPAALRL